MEDKSNDNASKLSLKHMIHLKKNLINAVAEITKLRRVQKFRKETDRLMAFYDQQYLKVMLITYPEFYGMSNPNIFPNNHYGLSLFTSCLAVFIIEWLSIKNFGSNITKNMRRAILGVPILICYLGNFVFIPMYKSSILKNLSETIDKKPNLELAEAAVCSLYTGVFSNEAI